MQRSQFGTQVRGIRLPLTLRQTMVQQPFTLFELALFEPGETRIRVFHSLFVLVLVLVLRVIGTRTRWGSSSTSTISLSTSMSMSTTEAKIAQLQNLRFWSRPGRPINGKIGDDRHGRIQRRMLNH